MESIKSQILSRHLHQLKVLADSWLASGATSFAIWQDGTPLFHWPAKSSAQGPSVSARIKLGLSNTLEIRVTGQDSPAAKSRLRAEAGLIAQLINLSNNLNSVTAELVDTQDQLLAIYNLTQATRNHIAIEKLLSQLAYETTNIVNQVASAFILLELPGNVSFAEYYPSRVLVIPRIKDAIATARQTGKIFMSSEEHSRGEEYPSNFVLIPIHIRGATFATLGLVKGEGDFMSPDLKLAGAIAEHAGAQIENVLLYQKNLEQMKLHTEMELARQVQLNLLPQSPPSVTGLDLWATSRPALQVGGDFYDFHLLPGSPLSFTVGDISGKGLPAAILMSMTRTVIRAKAHDSPAPSPGKVMWHANEELYADFTDVNMFATVFIGQFDPSNRKLTFANAGHSPVIYCPAKGKARLLEADGTALGVLPTSLSEDQQLEFHPSDLLVVGTDGLNETQNDAEELFGYDRLLNLVESLSDLPAREIGNQLYSAVNQFGAGQPQFDDQTIMVLKGI